MHAGLLAHTVGPVRSLVLSSQVPPRVIVNHHIRRRQVEASASSLQGDQKHLRAAGLKGLHQLSPLLLRGVPLERIAGNAQLV